MSNIDADGTLVDLESPRGQASKVRSLRFFSVTYLGWNLLTLYYYIQGNSLFHVDSSFNPRRAGNSLLLAHELPPPGTGGRTAFADTRSAYDDLPRSVKEDLLRNNYIADHSLLHSRKLAAPEFFAKVNPLDFPMSRHRLVQMHEPSGRMNLYIAAHAHHIEGIEPEASKELLDQLYEHAIQPKYVFEVEWENVGDMVMWDNTCVMHRAVGGVFETKHKRDMRRATVHDSSSQAWGLNMHSDERLGLP